MSVKVYQGFKFLDSSIHTVFAHLQEFRKRVHELAIEAEGEYLANTIVHRIDLDVVNGKPSVNYISEAIREMRDQQMESESKGIRHPATDFEFKVMIMPYCGELYGIVFTERSSWYNEFIDNPWVKDYWYASVEKPKNVSQEEWNTRGVVWKEMMKPSYVPSQHGFEMDLGLERYRWPDTNNVLKHVKSFGDRVRSTANDKLIAERMKYIRDADPKAYEDSIFGAMFAASDWAKTEEGQARHRELMKEIEPMLQHVIDLDTMRGGKIPSMEAVESMDIQIG